MIGTRAHGMMTTQRESAAWVYLYEHVASGNHASSCRDREPVSRSREHDRREAASAAYSHVRGVPHHDHDNMLTMIMSGSRSRELGARGVCERQWYVSGACGAWGEACDVGRGARGVCMICDTTCGSWCGLVRSASGVQLWDNSC